MPARSAVSTCLPSMRAALTTASIGQIGGKTAKQHAQNGWIYFAFADPKENAKGEKVSLTKIIRGKIRGNALVEQQIEVVVADAGYWQKQGIQDLVNQGMQTLVPPDAHKRKGARPGRRAR